MTSLSRWAGPGVPPSPQWACPAEKKWWICIFEHARSKSDIGGAWGRRHGVGVRRGTQVKPGTPQEMSEIGRVVSLQKAVLHCKNTKIWKNRKSVNFPLRENIKECWKLAEKCVKSCSVAGLDFTHFSANFRHSLIFFAGGGS